MNKRHTLKVGKHMGMACLLFVCATMQSCRDEYLYDNPEYTPEWLGESIYEELQDGLRDNESPDGWSFKYFLQVIDDCDYTDVLMKTGSKTLFVADDSAFVRGVKKAWPNITGTTGDEVYAQLGLGQKRTILFSAMLDNAYLLEMMSSTPAVGTGDPNPGQALRHETAASVLDTIYTYSADEMPANNPYWDTLRLEGSVRMALDNTKPMMVHFLEEQLDRVGITDKDLSYLVSRKEATKADAYIFDKKVIKRDITCKNGYINLLDELLIPPSNMAEEIRKNPNLTLYSRILDRFAVPVWNETLSEEYYQKLLSMDPNAQYEDIYEKRYFTSGSNRNSFGAGFLAYKDINGNNHETVADDALAFSPGWNQYRSEQFPKDEDMAAMFVPTNEALMTYFSPGGKGASLIDRYGNGAPLPQAIDSIDLNIIAKLVRNMMEPSFNQSVPSKFSSLKNDANDDKGIKAEHLDDIQPCIVANNGVIYVTREVYSPAEYVSVSAPAMLNEDMYSFYKLITKVDGENGSDTDYNSYLLAMQTDFSLINPVNDALIYFDPATAMTSTPIGTGAQTPKYYTLTYDVKNEAWTIKEGTYTFGTDTLGMPSINLSKKPTVVADNASMDFLKYLKIQILDHSIVVGDIANGNKYHQTKGLSTIKVNSEIVGTDTVIHLWGGRELENQLAGYRTDGIEVTRKFNQENGNTYRVEEGMVHPATRSVYNILAKTEEFRPFLDLCEPANDSIILAVREVDEDGADPTKNADAAVRAYRIFEYDQSFPGLDYNVTSFNAFHYTLYVPDSLELQKAVDAGIPRWDELTPLSDSIWANIRQIKTWNETILDKKAEQAVVDSLKELRAVLIDENAVLRAELKEYVELIADFVKYHMQDYSVYLDYNPVLEDGEYVTASKENTTNLFNNVTITSGRNALAIKDAAGNTRHVVAQEGDGKENILWNVMARDIKKSSGKLSTSSFVVIHQIDGCLDNGRWAATMEKFNEYRNKNK